MSVSKNHMIDEFLIPEQDHELTIKCISGRVHPEGGRYINPGTVSSYVNTYRLALGALSESNARLLDLPIVDRFLGVAAQVIVTTLEARLAPVDVIATTRQTRHVLRLMTGIRFETFDIEIRRVRRAAISAGTLVRPGRKAKGVIIDESFPKIHLDALDRLNIARKKDGTPISETVRIKGIEEYLLFLGVLERAGVPWRNLDPCDLVSETCFEHLANAWCPNGENTQRLNYLTYVTKIMCPSTDFACASRVMARYRGMVPGSNIAKGYKNNITIAGLPPEDAERFAFACPEYAAAHGLTVYSQNDDQFEYDGRVIDLVRKASRVSSQEGFQSALRAMVTTLHESAPEMVSLGTDQRDYDVVAKL